MYIIVCWKVSFHRSWKVSFHRSWNDTESTVKPGHIIVESVCCFFSFFSKFSETWHWNSKHAERRKMIIQEQQHQLPQSTYPLSLLTVKFQYKRKCVSPFCYHQKPNSPFFFTSKKNDCHHSPWGHSPLFLRPAEDAGDGPRHRAGSHQHRHHKRRRARGHQAGLQALRRCFCLWRGTVCGRSHSRSSQTWPYCFQRWTLRHFQIVGHW